jgi:hypothetical protein
MVTRTGRRRLVRNTSASSPIVVGATRSVLQGELHVEVDPYALAARQKVVETGHRWRQSRPREIGQNTPSSRAGLYHENVIPGPSDVDLHPRLPQANGCEERAEGVLDLPSDGAFAAAAVSQ